MSISGYFSYYCVRQQFCPRVQMNSEHCFEDTYITDERRDPRTISKLFDVFLMTWTQKDTLDCDLCLPLKRLVTPKFKTYSFSIFSFQTIHSVSLHKGTIYPWTRGLNVTTQSESLHDVSHACTSGKTET